MDAKIYDDVQVGNLGNVTRASLKEATSLLREAFENQLSLSPFVLQGLTGTTCHLAVPDSAAWAFTGGQPALDTSLLVGAKISHTTVIG